MGDLKGVDSKVNSELLGTSIYVLVSGVKADVVFCCGNDIRGLLVGVCCHVKPKDPGLFIGTNSESSSSLGVSGLNGDSKVNPALRGSGSAVFR